jgi:hypothetical protein
MRRIALFAGLLALASAEGSVAQEAMDPANPTCPKSLNFSTYRQMRFTLEEVGGQRILRAEGAIDESVPDRLKAALAEHEPIDEIWVRSPGGNARAGNAAGKLIRQAMIPTRIPKGWACFSACNFLFMGGAARMVDKDGVFAVHMFTHTGDREAIKAEVGGGEEKALALIGSVEQESALLASEDNDFLIRMGVSRKLLTDVMYRQKAVKEQGADRSTRRCLTHEEAWEYKVANIK